MLYILKILTSRIRMRGLSLEIIFIVALVDSDRYNYQSSKVYHIL